MSNQDSLNVQQRNIRRGSDITEVTEELRTGLSPSTFSAKDDTGAPGFAYEGGAGGNVFLPRSLVNFFKRSVQSLAHGPTGHESSTADVMESLDAAYEGNSNFLPIK